MNRQFSRFFSGLPDFYLVLLLFGFCCQTDQIVFWFPVWSGFDYHEYHNQFIVLPKKKSSNGTSFLLVTYKINNTSIKFSFLEF
jgi:hypothetical protein